MPNLHYGNSGEHKSIFGLLELDLARESFDEPQLCIYGQLWPALTRGISGKPKSCIFDS